MNVNEIDWGVSASSVTIVCSDCTRNGKTLFAKLAADLLCLRKGEAPFIFDTNNPDGSLLTHFPGCGKIVDIARTNEHVAMFDGMIGANPQAKGGGHFLVDLSTRHLKRFFDIFRDVDFQTGASEVGLDVSIFFVIDRNENSIAHAADLAGSLPNTRFIPIRNMAFGNSLEDWHAVETYKTIDHDREIVLPELSAEALGMLEHPEFHFDAFVAGNYEHFPFELKNELWRFLKSLYEQRGSAGDGAAHPI